jgi:prevent-host-death family protein
MKTATAKELRYKTGVLLENVRKGENILITFRGKSVAILKPLKKISHEFITVGFGMWKSKKMLKNIEHWINKRREARFKK